MTKNKMTLLLIALVTLPATTMAAGGGGTIADLLYPAINFSLLFGFIIWKLKKPMSEAFTKNAKDVEDLYNLAEEKYKEAQIKYDSYAKKLEQLDSEITRIHSETDQNVKSFTDMAKKETASTIERMERDTNNKLDSERNKLIMDLNRKLVEEVVNKTKSTIADNKEYKTKVTNNLVSSIQ